MTPTTWQRALCAAALTTAMAAPALAAVVTFEDVVPGTLMLPGDTLAQGGHELTLLSGIGVVDTSAAFGPGVGLDLAAPLGNAGQYFLGLNDGALNMRAGGGASFRLAGLDFAYVAALTQLFNPGEDAGRLVAGYEADDGSIGFASWSFGLADANGEFGFQTLGLADMGALASGVREVYFFACTYDINGDCVQQNSNFSQFALDNMVVPEPGSLALVLLALGVAGGLRMRRAS